MNDIIRIKSNGLPDVAVPQLPQPICEDSAITPCPPEFWLTIQTTQQQLLIEELEENELEYRVSEIVDSVPAESKDVCRSKHPYIEAETNVKEICRRINIDSFVVSDGSLSSVSANGELQGFISFD